MTLEEHLNRSRLVRRLRAGPLGDWIDLYTDRLLRDGYHKDHAGSALHILILFSQWLADHGFDPHAINEHLVGRFLKFQARRHPLRNGDRTAMTRLIAVLREAQVIAPRPPAVLDGADQILEGFRDYLERRRGLSPTSAEAYVYFVRPFMRATSITHVDHLAGLTPDDVIGYVEQHAHDGSPATAGIMCARVRSFLRYLHVEGLVETDLAACVPSIKKWRMTGLPTYLSAAQLQRVFQSCNRQTAVGRRDYAVLMLLAKLGLRAKEVATLTLDDIDWRAGNFRIQGKGRRAATMPLPPDIGVAIVAYLRDGRPASDSRKVFLRACPVHAGFPTAGGIKDIARRALKRADISGLAHHGAHVLRHSLATELLRSGATLTQIGQVLRHQDHDTTRIYAKVDLASLRTLSLPWLGGVQ
jgi:site-specific recombinase XerD